MQNDSIPIFLASDDLYSPYLCSTIYSILINTKEYIEFYILDNKISEESKSLIKKSLKSFKNYSIEYIDISDFGLDRFPNLKHYSINTFSRYFIPDLKPNFDKILYLDVDIIVKGNIAELYNQDIENYCLCATSENFYERNGVYLKENIHPKYKDTKNYFNAGVLVMNIAKIREKNLMQLCIDKTIELADKLSCADQDILNIVYENETNLINQKFDYMPDFYDYYKGYYGEDKANELKNSAVIIHYTAGKPWFNLSCMSKDFWKIINKTEFKKIVKDRYKQYKTNHKTNKLSLLQQIFSVTNQKGKNKKTYKVITLFGIKFKFKK